ncbi:MAG: hypothetical protein IAE80_04580 [Anaerolinea sp.]|nr:hypothetical protein [Anaerolinea sp.]
MKVVALVFIIAFLLLRPRMVRSTFDVDWAWAEAVRQNEYRLWKRKLPPQRTKTWERLNFFRGCVIIGAWIYLVFAMLNQLINSA